MKEEKEFQTESKELLNLMINSIYSNPEIFLREILSNASDAIDKYQFLAIQDPKKYPLKNFLIRIVPDKAKRTLTVIDNGIGMNREDMEKNLGTIARSGSREFVRRFEEMKKQKDLGIIGQFGVGFYSIFMVAEKVEVRSKRVDSTPVLFTSDGVEKYTVEDVEDKDLGTSGTSVTLYLKPDTKDVSYSSYLEDYRIEELVKKYSDYLHYPIRMAETHTETEKDKDGKEIPNSAHPVTEDKVLNSRIPLWKKPKSQVTDKDLAEFYKNRFDDYEDPLVSLYVKAEGLANYSALLFIPAHAPYDLYSQDYEKGLSLYSQGIFIQEKCKDLVPDYLKFVKGLVDSDDFPLNISREMLQKSPAMARIANALETKLLEKLKDLEKNDRTKYEAFYKEYGNYLKYGIYSSYGTNKEKLQDLLLFPSLKEKKLVSLSEYLKGMAPDQKYIYYASGRTQEEIRLMPQLESFKDGKEDVLLLDQEPDEFALLSMRDYGKKEFKNVAEVGATQLSEDEKKEQQNLTDEHRRLLDDLKAALKGKVDDVLLDVRLGNSPVALSTQDGLSLNMEEVYKRQPGVEKDAAPKARKVLALNPKSPLFETLASLGDDDKKIEAYGPLLYEEARLVEGYDVEDKKGFVESLNAILSGRKEEKKPSSSEDGSSKPQAEGAETKNA